MAITTIPGSNGGDTSIIGTIGADTIKPTDFEKLYVDGKEANDKITFTDATTGVTAYGNDGDDTITYAAVTGGTINGNKGNDDIVINGDVDRNAQVYGGQGNDDITFKGLVENVTEVGGSIGVDTIKFEKNVSKTKILGNQDADTITLSDLGTSVSVYGGKGGDTISLEEVTGSIISGDKGADEITTTSHSNSTSYLGGDDDDTITIGDNDDNGKGNSIEGGEGRDAITVKGDSKFVIYGNTGNDTIITTDSGSAQTVYGGQGDDTLTSNNAKDNVLKGDKGGDTITAGTGKDTIEGGDGDDFITAGDTGTNSVNGGAGADTIDGGDNADTLFGGKGADTIQSGGGKDYISGDADDDVIQIIDTGFTADDTIKGGSGTNTLAITSAADDNATSVLDVDFTGVTDIAKIDLLGESDGNTVELGAKADAAGVVTVTAKDATSTGGGTLTVNGALNANDVSYTGSKTNGLNVKFTGGAGDDTFTSGTGNGTSTFDGGAGKNTFILENNATFTIVTGDLATGDVLKVDGGANTVAADGIADFKATSASTNSSDANDDVTLTAAVAGKINMDDANNEMGYSLIGNTGAESLVGSDKDDIFHGEAGVDTLTGGTGADDFKLYDVATVDNVTDFTVAQTDQFGFSLADVENQALTDLVGLDAANEAANTAMNVLTVNATAAVDLNGTDTGKEVALFSGNYNDATGALLQADIRNNLTVAGNFAAGDAFIGVYDTGAGDSYLVTVETDGGVNNAKFADAQVVVIGKLAGLADATTITDNNIMDIVA